MQGPPKMEAKKGGENAPHPKRAKASGERKND